MVYPVTSFSTPASQNTPLHAVFFFPLIWICSARTLHTIHAVSKASWSEGKSSVMKQPSSA